MLCHSPPSAPVQWNLTQTTESHQFTGASSGALQSPLPFCLIMAPLTMKNNTESKHKERVSKVRAVIFLTKPSFPRYGLKPCQVGRVRRAASFFFVTALL